METWDEKTPYKMNQESRYDITVEHKEALGKKRKEPIENSREQRSDDAMPGKAAQKEPCQTTWLPP